MTTINMELMSRSSEVVNVIGGDKYIRVYVAIAFRTVCSQTKLSRQDFLQNGDATALDINRLHFQHTVRRFTLHYKL